MRIEWYDGDRAAIRWLFALAEDSDVQLDAYLALGRVLVARDGDRLVGHLQLVPREGGAAEIVNMAVVEAERGAGIGRALVEAALGAAARAGATRVLVATGAASAGNLRFYQRCGFRMLSVERDAFTPHTGYPETILVEGIVLRDRVWLDRDIAGAD